MNSYMNRRILLSFVLAAAAIPALGQAAAPPAAPDLPDAPGAAAKPEPVPTGPTVLFDTSMGRLTCKLFDKQAPNAVANFIGLAEGTKEWNSRSKKGDKLYDGTVFHRVIPNFMIQGGDPEGTGMGGPGYKFADETKGSPHHFQKPGKLAMANSGPNTNGSQFFITEQAVESLNQHYTLFGQCDESSVLVVKTIARVARDPQDKPMKDVVVQSVVIERVG